MNLIQNISSLPFQQITFVLGDGTSFSMTLYFVPMQYGWFITNITYKTFVLNSIRVTNLPNLLYQWQNIIPFGLSCFSPSQREPSQATDFVNGLSNLYVLTQAECQAYAAYIRGGALPA